THTSVLAVVAAGPARCLACPGHQLGSIRDSGPPANAADLSRQRVGVTPSCSAASSSDKPSARHAITCSSRRVKASLPLARSLRCESNIATPMENTSRLQHRSPQAAGDLYSMATRLGYRAHVGKGLVNFS